MKDLIRYHLLCLLVPLYMCISLPLKLPLSIYLISFFFFLFTCRGNVEREGSCFLCELYITFFFFFFFFSQTCFNDLYVCFISACMCMCARLRLCVYVFVICL